MPNKNQQLRELIDAYEKKMGEIQDEQMKLLKQVREMIKKEELKKAKKALSTEE